MVRMRKNLLARMTIAILAILLRIGKNLEESLRESLTISKILSKDNYRNLGENLRTKHLGNRSKNM